VNPVLGFTPDAPPATPGILRDCSNLIPYEGGMRAANSATAQGSAARAGEVRGAVTITKLDSTRRVFAGTTAKIEELSGTTWTDRSRAGAPAYALGATSWWSFAQFGDNTYAVNLDTVVQKSTTGAFADVSGAPKARVLRSLVTSSGGFLFACNTVDATFGTSPDRWWCSALNNGDDWTVNPSVTLCNSGRLLGADGGITTAEKLGNDRIVIYKDRSLYVGSFVGAPAVWSFQEYPNVGCVGLNAVVDIGTAHIFVGRDNFWMFDGARPVSIADGQLRQWFINNRSSDYAYLTQVIFDRTYKLIYIFFPSAGSTSCDKCIVYHLGTKQWGRMDLSVETVFLYNSSTVTWDTLSAATWDTWTDTPSWDFVASGSDVISYFNTSHTMQLLNGTPGASYMTLDDMGDDETVTRLTQCSLRYAVRPSTATVTAYYSMATGATPSTGLTISAYDVPAAADNKFKLRQTARFHRLQFNFTGSCSVTGYNVDRLQPAGGR
jgi:hypothetical protein